ncbi:isocitrate/isopropylmalate dehydrogenase family protein [Saccharopolyspora rosea]|uniref:Isocitrate/isopropylmalate dehydrogenase family protein n=1 Tax=Saccharopolyspora rosea TaxID=524884 RepID=A0ABW3FX09_9PSEU|nr:isocitrate/isopropylmalate family dehydrogenase [Saccharopolyspora rosea]
MVRIACIDGDGIGPELMDSAREVLAAAARADGFDVEFGDEPGGARVFSETGAALAPGALERFRSDYDAVLKGPVGLPEVRHPDGTEAGVLGGVLRGGLDTYANVRPVRLLPGVRTPTTHQVIDYVIVRENTEGLYLSRGSGVRNDRAASDQLLMTRVGVERVVRFAFELARRRSGAPEDGVRRVTCVDKSNVLRSFAFFRDVFDEVAARYPDVAADHRYSDAAAHDLVVAPAAFDVLVTENFLGDLLSDLGAATVGGLGMCPAGNIGADAAYFEPVHGSAPPLAGLDRANPTSQILSAAMLLEHVGRTGTARRITGAVESAYAAGAVRLGADGTPEGGTRAVTRAVVERL